MAEFADLRVFELIGGHGVDVHLDRRQSSARRDWYAWMIDNVVRADYVAVVAPPR
ncbi:hypothetical protein ILP97_05245 [Amycolatopsis sp. H6(2020)]|nr:hypothetical protein [Amycolatopsis sp. H6(2020)]